MRLVSRDGAQVELRISGHQFSDMHSDPWLERDWDPNWLIIEGDIRPFGHPAWTFREPAMTTWEAAEMATWLRDVADGQINTSRPRSRPAPWLSFTEPNISFAYTGGSGLLIHVEAELSYESGPPDELTPAHEHQLIVPLTLETAELRESADAWERELSHYPLR